jgi:hypothetical protein
VKHKDGEKACAAKAARSPVAATRASEKSCGADKKGGEKSCGGDKGKEKSCSHG